MFQKCIKVEPSSEFEAADYYKYFLMKEPAKVILIVEVSTPTSTQVRYLKDGVFKMSAPIPNHKLARIM